MLETSPQQRFQSASEILAALVQAPSNLGQPSSASQSASAPLSAPAVTPPPASVSPQPTPPPARKTPPPPLALTRLLGGAAFTGFEGGLLAIALTSFLGTTLMSGGFWLGLVAVLVYSQLQRWIERIDLVIIAGITLAIMLFLPALQGGNTLVAIVLLGVVSGLALMTLTLVFQLIYSVLSRFL